MPEKRPTVVYVDGYNLYYGRLRKSAWKWLDLVQLFRSLLAVQDPSAELIKLRYFTAPALPRFASHGQASDEAQKAYHRALEILYPDCFSKRLGFHTYEKNGTRLPAYVDGAPFDRAKKVKVWRLLEKQTDVNIALAMYRDARAGGVSQMVLCSNDSDAEPTLAAIREDFTDITCGLVSPVRKPEAGQPEGRYVNQSLSRLCHWTRHYLRDEELAAAQLPNTIQTGRKPIRKPAHW